MNIAIFNLKRFDGKIPYFSKKYLELFVQVGHSVRYIEYNNKFNTNGIEFKGDLDNIDVIFYMGDYQDLQQVLTDYFNQANVPDQTTIITNQNLMNFSSQGVKLSEIDLDLELKEISKNIRKITYHNFSLYRGFHNVTPELIEYRNEIKSNMGIIFLVKIIDYQKYSDLNGTFFESLKNEGLRVVYSDESNKINTLMPWIIQQCIVANKLKNNK